MLSLDSFIRIKIQVTVRDYLYFLERIEIVTTLPELIFLLNVYRMFRKKCCMLFYKPNISD